MNIYKINIYSDFNKSDLNLAIGNFDGIHIGHQKIINKLVNHSIKTKLQASIMSFTPHPREFFSKNNINFNIIDENQKIEILKKLEIKNYISFKFDKDLSNLDPKDFIRDILVKKLKIKNLTIGYDFRFGKNRKGDLKLLKDLSSYFNYNLTIVEPIINSKTSEKYSSTSVRENIMKGRFENVSKLLGRNWKIYGKVIKGDQKARKFDFPTANIIPGNHIRPLKGVYAVKIIFHEKSFDGIANFGERPTVNGNKLILEVHIFNFDKDIYGKELTVEFLAFIRKEKKFDNFNLLIEQIQKDILIAKKYHQEK